MLGAGLTMAAAVAVGALTGGSGEIFPRKLATVVSGGWAFPMPAWRDRVSGRLYKPTQSDGWGSPRDGGSRTHLGSDVMYKRRSVVRDAAGKIIGGDLHNRFPVYRDGHAGWFFCPPGLADSILAVRDGDVWHARYEATGWTVVLSHPGTGLASRYTHLEKLAPGIIQTSDNRSKQKVRAGQPLGVCGASPKDGARIRHLHFELWRGGRENAFDPWPMMKSWPVVGEVSS